MFFPGAFLLTSVIMCVVALYTGRGTPVVSPYMWIAIVTMGIGICFVCLSLKVIEGVARTNDEVAFQRDVDIFKTSLRKFEEEKKPGLKFEFIEGEPPFRVEVDSEIKINYRLRLTKGEYAEDAQVFFCLPKGFNFPGKNAVIQSETHPVVPGHITYVDEFKEPIISAALPVSDIVIKAPSKADEYDAYYRVVCRGYVGEFEKFIVSVE